METKGTIVQQLERVIQKKEIRTNQSFLELKEANDFYNKLLESGIAKKRGFTLRGIEDSHLYHARLNSHI